MWLARGPLSHQKELRDGLAVSDGSRAGLITRTLTVPSSAVDSVLSVFGVDSPTGEAFIELVPVCLMRR